MFKWNKKGRIFKVDKNYDWMYSHTQCPIPIDFGDFIRVYFATREAYADGQCRAFGCFIDLDKNDFHKIIRISNKPLIELGEKGEFDEFGSMPNCVVQHGDEYYLYFNGWTRQFSVPYDWKLGMAISSDGENFKKVGNGPIIGPTYQEPYLTSGATSVFIDLDDSWHMFYHRGVQWIQHDTQIDSQYIIAYATSLDGISWQRDGKIIIPLKAEDECQTNPTIIKIGNDYHMFFCYRRAVDFRENRDNGYRIGYAYSTDLTHWERDDSQVGIDVSAEGWDSEMICYPYVTKIDGKIYMFYSGNYFGRDGIGYAELEM